MPNPPIVLEGFVSILAALESDSRDFIAIFVDEDKRFDLHVQRLDDLADQRELPFELVERDFLEEYTTGTTHGGVVAIVDERRYLSPPQLIQDKTNPLIVMLDGVEDPFNFGYAVRSLYAAGVDGMVVNQRDWDQATATIVRASAGASERMPIAQMTSAEAAAAFFKGNGLRIACTAKRQDAVSLYDADLTQPTFLLIGGEKRGITRAFIDQADTLIEIPYGRDFDQSLGAVGAASILSFEAMRQRR